MEKKSPLFLIFLTVFIDLLGFGILIPILPTFATKELHVDETAIGIAIAIYSFTQFLFNPFFGELSDKHGRRPVIIICLFLNAAGYLIFAFTESYITLLISRFVAGIGGSTIGVAQAYIADVTTKENRAKGMGLIGAAFGLGFVFGPLMGGLLASYSYTFTGLASALFSFFAFGLTYFFLPESNLKRNVYTRKRKLIDIKAIKSLYKNPLLGALVTLFFILTFSVANIYGTFALLGYQVYGFTDTQNGFMYGIVGIVAAVVQGGLPRIVANRIPDKTIIQAGSLLMMIGLAFMPYGGNFLGLAIIVIIQSIGTGALQPTILSLVSRVASETEQGITLGLNQSISAFARVLGPLWGGFAFEYLGYPYPFLTGAAFTLIILIMSVSYLPKKLSEHKFHLPGEEQGI